MTIRTSDPSPTRATGIPLRKVKNSPNATDFKSFSKQSGEVELILTFTFEGSRLVAGKRKEGVGWEREKKIGEGRWGKKIRSGGGGKKREGRGVEKGEGKTFESCQLESSARKLLGSKIHIVVSLSTVY